jgi:hypothetical protein
VFLTNVVGRQHVPPGPYFHSSLPPGLYVIDLPHYAGGTREHGDTYRQASARPQVGRHRRWGPRRSPRPPARTLAKVLKDCGTLITEAANMRVSMCDTPLSGSLSRVTGNLFGADTDVDGEQCHQRTEGEDGHADEQASDVPVSQGRRSRVAGDVVLGDDRGGGG